MLPVLLKRHPERPVHSRERWSWALLLEDRDLLSTELRDILGALDVVVVADAVHPVMPIDEHRLRTDVLGEALQLCESIRTGHQLLDGLDAGVLAGLTSADPDAAKRYVRRLLEGADGEVAARLLENGSS